MHGCMKMETEKDYIKYKARVLKQLGLKNETAVLEYLKKKTAKATSESQKEIQCDIAARTILMDFYDGDMTFVKKG